MPISTPVPSKLVRSPISYTPFPATSFRDMHKGSACKRTVLLCYKNGCPYCIRFFPYWHAIVSICSRFENANFISIEKQELLDAMEKGHVFGGSVSSYPTLRVVEHMPKKVRTIAQWDNDQPIMDGPSVDRGFEAYNIDRFAFEDDVVASDDPDVRAVSIPKLGLLLTFIRSALAA